MNSKYSMRAPRPSRLHQRQNRQRRVALQAVVHEQEQELLFSRARPISTRMDSRASGLGSCTSV